MCTALIQLQNVSKIYPNTAFSGVSNISLQIHKAETLVILGESGSGKSTLLKLIFGLLSPDEGNIFCENEHVLGPAEKLIPGHPKMRMLTQNFELNTFASVYDNIASELSNTDLEAKKAKTEEIIDILKLSSLKNNRLKTLSGGEQQRVALAKAIITQPPILLLDEPFSQLDTLLKKQLMEDIERLKNHFQTTIIMVSHDPNDAYYMADKVMILRNGKLQQYGNVADIKQNPSNSYVAELFSFANIISNPDLLQILNPSIPKNHQILIYPEDINFNTNPQNIPIKLLKIKNLNFYQQIYFEIFEGLTLYAITPQFEFTAQDALFVDFKKVHTLPMS